MLLSQSINSIAITLDLPDDADISDIIQDAQDFCVGGLIDLLPQEAVDQQVIDEIDAVLEKGGNLDAVEAVIAKHLSPEVLEAGKQKILVDLQSWLTDEGDDEQEYDEVY